MSCVNKSSVEFQKLLEETHLKEDILAAKIAKWQDDIGTDDTFPTKEEVLTYASRFEITDAQREAAVKELEQFTSNPESLYKKIDFLFKVIDNNWNRLKNASNLEIRKLFNNPHIGSEFEFMWKRLKQAHELEKEGVNFEQKIRSFALTIQELDAVVSKLKDRVRETDFNLMSDNEQLKEISKYVSFLQDWQSLLTEQDEEGKSLIDEFVDAGSIDILKVLYSLKSNVETTLAFLTNPREQSVIRRMITVLGFTSEGITKKYEESIKNLRAKRLNAHKRKNAVNVAIYDNRIKQIQERYDKENLSPEMIRKLLFGKLGDTNAASALLESKINSPDPIIFGVKKHLKDTLDAIFQKVKSIDFKMQKELKPFLEALNASRFNIYDFNKQLTQFVRAKDKDGNVFYTAELMNEFTGGWQQEIKDFLKEIEELIEEGDEEAVKEKQLEFAKWKRKYMYQEFKDKVYDRYELWHDAIGKEAYDRRQIIFNKMNALNNKNKTGTSAGFELTAEEEVLYQSYLNELQQLSSLFDENGDPKIDEEQKIAERISEYNRKTKDVYTWKEKKGSFEGKRRFYREYLEALKQTDPSVDIDIEMKEWDDKNTRTVISPEFYIERQRILDKINNLSKRIKEKGDKDVAESFIKGWETIFSQLKGYRDADGQPIGSELSEGKTEKVRDELVKMESLKTKLEGISGLSSDEWDILRKYKTLQKIGIGLTVDQRKEKKELEEKRKGLGLSKAEKEEFYDAVNELKDIQSRIPTEYYVNQLNLIAAPFAKVYDTVTADELLDDPELKVLLGSPAFKKWFEKNHIQVERYDSDKGKKVKRWERLYTWNRIVPNDPKYYETTTLQNGKVVQGKPTLKYYYRDIRDEVGELKKLREKSVLDTEDQKRFDELEEKELNDELVSYKTEKIVGKTVDNRGRWLPKSVDALDDTQEYWDDYVNHEFLNLQKNASLPEGTRNEDDYNKYNIIEIYKKYSLEYQEGLPYYERIWYSLPALPKEFVERVLSLKERGKAKEKLRDTWESLKEKINFRDKASQDEGTINPELADKNIVKADLFGNQLSDIVVRHAWKMDEKILSYNIGRGITQMGLSAESKKALIEEEPLVKALEIMLDRYGVKDLGTFKKVWNKIASNIPRVKKYEVAVKAITFKGNYTRLNTVRNLQDEYFKGIMYKGLFGGVRSEFGDYAAMVLNGFKGVMAWAVLVGDWTGGVVNSFTGNTYALFKSVTGVTFTFTDYVKAFVEFHTLVLKDFAKDVNQPLGKRSFYSQLFDLFDPQQSFTKDLGGKYNNNGWLHTGQIIKQVFLNIREYGEIQIAATIMLATLRNVRVKDASGKLISLTDAYEIGADGEIALKPGINFSKEKFDAVKGNIRTVLEATQGNYAKTDKAEIEKWTLGSILFFMRKYLVPTFLDAWKIRRFNGYTGYGAGYNLVAIEVMKLGLQGISEKYKYLRDQQDESTAKEKFMFGIKATTGAAAGFNSASREEWGRLAQTIAFYTSSLFFHLWMSSVDPDDDKTKYKKVREWSWQKIYTMLLLLRIKSEVEQNTIIGGRNEAVKLVKNPLLLGSKLSQLNSLLDYMWATAVADSEKDKSAYYQDKGGWRERMIELYGTDSKALITFYMVIGFKGGGIQGINPATEGGKKKGANMLIRSASAQKRN